MTTLNKTTKKAESMLWSYEHSTCYDIYEAYTKPSYNKIRAWETCKNQCYEKNGHGLKITGANSSFFSAGFIFESEGKKYLQYITACNDFIIEVE